MKKGIIFFMIGIVFISLIAIGVNAECGNTPFGNPCFTYCTDMDFVEGCSAYDSPSKSICHKLSCLEAGCPLNSGPLFCINDQSSSTLCGDEDCYTYDTTSFSGYECADPSPAGDPAKPGANYYQIVDLVGGECAGPWGGTIVTGTNTINNVKCDSSSFAIQTMAKSADNPLESHQSGTCCPISTFSTRKTVYLQDKDDQDYDGITDECVEKIDKSWRGYSQEYWTCAQCGSIEPVIGGGVTYGLPVNCFNVGRNDCDKFTCYDSGTEKVCGSKCSATRCNKDDICYNENELNFDGSEACCPEGNGGYHQTYDSNFNGIKDKCCTEDTPIAGDVYEVADHDNNPSTPDSCDLANEGGQQKKECKECTIDSHCVNQNEGNINWKCCHEETCYDSSIEHCCGDKCDSLLAAGSNPDCSDYEECCDTTGDGREDTKCSADEHCCDADKDGVFECKSSEDVCDNYDELGQPIDDDCDGKGNCKDPDCKGIKCSDEDPEKGTHCGVCIRTSEKVDKICCGTVDDCGAVSDVENADSASGCPEGKETVDYDTYCYDGGCTPNSAPYVKGEDVPPGTKPCNPSLPLEIKNNPPEVQNIYYLNVNHWSGFESGGYITYFKDGGSCTGHTPPPEGYREETAEGSLECKVWNGEEEVGGGDCNALKLDSGDFNELFLSSYAGTIVVKDDGIIEGLCSGDNIQTNSRSATTVCPGGVRDLGGLSFHGEVFIGIGWPIPINWMLYKVDDVISNVEMEINPHDPDFCTYPTMNRKISFYLSGLIHEQALNYIFLRVFIFGLFDYSPWDEKPSLPEELLEMLTAKGDKSGTITTTVTPGAIERELTVDYIHEGTPKTFRISGRKCLSLGGAKGAVHRAAKMLVFGETLFHSSMIKTFLNVIPTKKGSYGDVSLLVYLYLDFLDRWNDCCPFEGFSCDEETASGGTSTMSVISSSVYFVEGYDSSLNPLRSNIYYLGPKVQFDSPVSINLQYDPLIIDGEIGPPDTRPVFYRIDDDYLENNGISFTKLGTNTFDVLSSGGIFSSNDGDFTIDVPVNALPESKEMEISRISLNSPLSLSVECSSDEECGSPYAVENLSCYDGYLVKNYTKIPVCVHSGTKSSYCSEMVLPGEIIGKGLDEICVNDEYVVESCFYESDGGVNYPEKGYVSTASANFTDFCYLPTSLVEYSCSSNILNFVEYNCTSICWEDECSSYLADTNNDKIVSMQEMLGYFEEYYNSTVSSEELMEAYHQWRR